MAVLLGVVVALVIAAGCFAIYLVNLPSDGTTAVQTADQKTSTPGTSKKTSPAKATPEGAEDVSKKPRDGKSGEDEANVTSTGKNNERPAADDATKPRAKDDEKKVSDKKAKAPAIPRRHAAHTIAALTAMFSTGN